MKKKNYRWFVKENVIKTDISYRGGTLEVDASELFPSLGCTAIVGAYQNYLGGGMAGAIVGAAQFHPGELNARERKIFGAVLEACKLYFYELNNGGGDQYMQENYNSFDFNQGLPVSAY